MVITTTLQPVASFSFRAAYYSVQVVRVGDGLHGCTIQGAIGINSNLAGGIRNLLYTNNCFHCNSCLPYFSSAPPMTIIWTSLVPS